MLFKEVELKVKRVEFREAIKLKLKKMLVQKQKSPFQVSAMMLADQHEVTNKKRLHIFHLLNPWYGVASLKLITLRMSSYYYA